MEKVGKGEAVGKGRQRQEGRDTPSVMFLGRDSNPWKHKGNVITWGFCFLPHFLKYLGRMRILDE